MLKTSRAYVRQAIVADGSQMARFTSTVLGRARQALEGVFRRTPTAVPQQAIVVAKPPVGIVANALSGVCRGRVVSKFLARSHPSDLVTVARSRYGSPRLVTGFWGAGRGGNAFRGLGQKLSMFAFVTVGVAAGVDESQMRRLAGFDTVHSSILALFQSSKDRTDVTFQSCDNVFPAKVNEHVFHEFSTHWNEEQKVSSFVLVRNESNVSFESSFSDDSDIVVLSDEIDQKMRGSEELFVVDDDVPEVLLVADSEPEEEFVVCDHSSDFVDVEPSALSDDFERPSLIDELKVILTAVQVQGEKLSALREAMIQRNVLMNELGLDPVDQSDVSSAPDEENLLVSGENGSDLTYALGVVARQKRALDALHRAITNQNKKIRSAQNLQSINDTQNLVERHACGEHLNIDRSAYSKRDACCGPGLLC